MSLFDDHIEQIARYLVRMRATGRPVREMQAGGLLFKVGPSAGPGLVLKSETFMELGSPTVGSSATAASHWSDRT
jgi:hypothetical protein